MLAVVRGACVAAGCASLVGCGGRVTVDEPSKATQVAVGRLDATDAVVAILRDDDAAVAYVCGGASSYDRLTRWYRGAGSDLESSGWGLRTDADGLSGTVREPDGSEHTWSAEPALGGAGLYTTVDSGCRAGVVVDAEGSVQGVWCDGGGRFAQVTPVTPIDAHAFDVDVVLPEGTRVLHVTRALSTTLPE